MKIAIVLGTRPEIIKMSPIIDEIKSEDELLLIHTGQHYDKEMSKDIFNDLKLPKPKYNLEVGSGNHGVQTGLMMKKLEEIFLKEKPDIILVQGDTNAVLAGALVSTKLHIPVGHVEAGLRSNDNTMPEEINRKIADICSNLYFVPTEESALNLVKENISRKNIYITGNTIVDTCFRNLKIAQSSFDDEIKNFLDLENLIILTTHRAEIVDNKKRLSNIIEAITELRECNIVFPIHPRTKNKLIEFDLYEVLKETKHIHIIPPLSYLNFLMLLSKAKLILTDSGGLQEEAITLNIPALTLRYNTERPETVESGGNILVGTDKDKIIYYSKKIFEGSDFNHKMKSANNPYGNGDSAKKIINIIKDEYEKGFLAIKNPNILSQKKELKLLCINEDITIKDYENKYKTEIKQVFIDENIEYPKDNLNLNGSHVIIEKIKEV